MVRSRRCGPGLPDAERVRRKGRRAHVRTAYLEYGIAQDLTRGTDRRMWFLHDPIEDHPDRTWEDYLANYQRTLVASLLHPGVSRYEVAPWPNRIFNRPYLREGSTERQPIPPDTATSYLIAMNSLRDLDQPDVRWARTADHGSGSRSLTPRCSSAGRPVARVDTTTACRTRWRSKAASSSPLFRLLRSGAATAVRRAAGQPGPAGERDRHSRCTRRCRRTRP